MCVSLQACKNIVAVLQFCRSDPTLSQYESYLQYTKTIGEEMGFVVCEDQLKIPSSKKVVLSVPFYCLLWMCCRSRYARLA